MTSDFITKVLKLMVALGLVTSLYGVYQLVIGYPEFELYWIRNTEFYTSMLWPVERALATYSVLKSGVGTPSLRRLRHSAWPLDKSD